MKKHYYFFMILFLFLTRIVNAQLPIRHVWSIPPGEIIGIENMDNDPDKEIVLLYLAPNDLDPDAVTIYKLLTGEVEYQIAGIEVITEPLQGLGWGAPKHLPSLVDFNKDGIYELLINCKYSCSDCPMPESYAWRLFAFGGTLKPVKQVVK